VRRTGRLRLQTLLASLAVGIVTLLGPAAAEESAPGDACSARVVFVPEPTGLEALRRILADRAEHLRQTDVSEAGPPESPATPNLLLRLAPGHCADFVWPRTAEAGEARGTEHVLLASSPWYELGDGRSLADVLVGIDPVEPAPRLADAVTVAATALGDPPAAVILVAAAGAEDGSRLGDDEAVAALERAGVPLRVWWFERALDREPDGESGGEPGGEPGPPAWAGAAVERVDIAAWEELEGAVDALRELVAGGE